MITADYNYQYIDWSHDPVLGEPFNHLGNLITNVITPSVTIGLSNYFNLTFKKSMGIRVMDWMGNSDSDHHRDESSMTDFNNAQGSILGDSNIILRYLLTNTGAKTGSRIFFGLGLTIPSNNVLTKSPYLNDDDGIAQDEHRHFSLSDGSYKTNYELQYYMKSKSDKFFMPVFYGLTMNYVDPLQKSKFGHLPGSSFNGVGSLLFNLNFSNKIYPQALSLGLIYLVQQESAWNGVKSPVGKVDMLYPTLGFVWNMKNAGNISLNFRYNNETPLQSDKLNNKSESIGITIGYRKTLDYTIPWLYW